MEHSLNALSDIETRGPGAEKQKTTEGGGCAKRFIT